MQIACAKYSCQKLVEVCYWACKFRPTCKDWQNALKETPGIDAIRESLETAAKKSGRPFDPQTLVTLKRVKRGSKG
jgi:hypothetical protein